MLKKHYSYYLNNMKLTDILNEVSLTPKAAEFLDTVQVSNNKIKNLRDITVDATPKGNWNVYYKGKHLMVVNGNLLDDRTISYYHLEKR